MVIWKPAYKVVHYYAENVYNVTMCHCVVMYVYKSHLKKKGKKSIHFKYQAIYCDMSSINFAMT